MTVRADNGMLEAGAHRGGGAARIPGGGEPPHAAQSGPQVYDGNFVDVITHSLQAAVLVRIF